MVYFYIILKIYTGLIKNQKKSFVGLYIKLKPMDNDNEQYSEEDTEYDCFTKEQLYELELENFLHKELDATLNFKEDIEKYIYDNYLSFSTFDFRKLRNIFLVW